MSRAAASVQQAEAAMKLVGHIADLLSKIDVTRAERILPVETDLDRFRQRAVTLAQDIDSSLAEKDQPAAITQGLVTRLGLAESTRQTRQSQEESLRAAQAMGADAEEKVPEARSRLKPLLDLTGVEHRANYVPW